MKNLILMLGMSVFLVACTSTTEYRHSENIDIIKDYVKSVENLDYESMSYYLDENYLGMGPSYGDSVNKIEAVENWKWNVTNLYEKIHYERSRFASVIIPEGENKGEWVANWAELSIVYKNDLGSAIIWANSNYLVKNGKIVRSITFYNEADALRQLGYIIKPVNYKE